jgi:hypothetical protein
MALGRALQAELLKMKRTLALWLALLAPAVMVLLQIAVAYRQHDYYLSADHFRETWSDYGQSTLMFWSLLMLPLFVTLETALLAALEHHNQQLKHLFALPAPRWALYAAKQLSGMAVIGISMAALFVLMIAGGLLLRLLMPGAGFEEPVPWARFITLVVISYLGAWLIISVHTWIGMRWSSFVVASAAGIVLTISGMIVINSDWGSFYPWALPGVLVNQLGKGVMAWPELSFGCLGGVVAAILGGWDVIRRDVL